MIPVCNMRALLILPIRLGSVVSADCLLFATAKRQTGVEARCVLDHFEIASNAIAPIFLFLYKFRWQDVQILSNTEESSMFNDNIRQALLGIPSQDQKWWRLSSRFRCFPHLRA